MLNPYAIILGLFVIAGFVTALWGWFIIVKARKTQCCPVVEGVVEQSTPTSEANDLPPHILFSYTVDARTYQCMLEFPGGTSPSPELASSYVLKYPVDAKVPVYYNPDQPGPATLEPGLTRGDWMIPVLGVAAMAFGIFVLFFGS